jgi:uncharacterized phage protein gp47/JayE
VEHLGGLLEPPVTDFVTNVPMPTLGPNGWIVPSQEDILIGVQADMQLAFNGNLNFTTSTGSSTNPTPQAQQATSFAAIIFDCFNQEVALFNGEDPAFATGRMLDALCRIYFLTRIPGSPTSVVATCVGLANTQIPIGALATDSSGNIYSCLQAGTIPVSGTIDLNFANINDGPIACPAGTLTTIYRAISGWDTITNASDGVLGAFTESDQALEQRRVDSVGAPSIGMVGSIIGAVAEVLGVLDYAGYQNDTGSPVTYQGVTVGANSVLIVVAGGSESAVAQAILTKKMPGCGMSGNTTVTAYDTNPLYVSPIPYTITYEVPSTLGIVFAVSIKNSSSVPSNAQALIAGAIANAFAGLPPPNSPPGAWAPPRARITSLLFASDYYPAIQALGSWAQIVSVQIGSSNSPAAQFTATISGTTMTASAVASGTIAIGQTLIGANIPDGVTITALGTGSGGTGTYTLSAPQTIGSGETMYGVVGGLNDLQVLASQIPGLNNVVLTLV